MSARRRRLTVCITKEVDVDITMEDFETEDLLDELLARGTLTKGQHEALSKEREIPSLMIFDPAQMECALWRLSLRDADGVLYHLENAIPAARGLAALLGKH